MVHKKRLARRKRKPMNVLVQGCESAERFEIILSFVSFRSKQVITMLTRHYVEGLGEELIVMMMDAGNWARAVTKVNDAARKIERIKELDGCVKVAK